MPVLKVKKNGVWEDVAGASGHTHTKSDITDFPSSLPANGGNADTLDGKHAAEFAVASDVTALQTQVNTLQENTSGDIEELQTKVGDTAVSEQIDEAIDNRVLILTLDEIDAICIIPLDPGLYVDGVMTADWDELVNSGAINIDGTLVYGDDDSASQLIGKFVIADGITEISNFEGCTGLTSVVLPDSVSSMDGRAFYGCTGLVSVTLPSSCTSIYLETFYDCTNLKDITNYDNLICVGDYAFGNCKALTYIPSSLKDVGYGAFSGCSSLRSVVIKKDVTYYGGTFCCCEYLRDVTIEEGVTSLPHRMFAQCGNLTSITIPASLTDMGDCVFEGTYLYSVTIADGATSIGGFEQSPGTFQIMNIPTSVTTIRDSAFMGCMNITSFVIPEGITTIGNGAFMNCTGLTSVDIASSVTTIGDVVFAAAPINTINFGGTIAQWNAISKGEYWCPSSPAVTIHCSDGDTSYSYTG